MNVNKVLKFCPECKEWYNPFIDPTWSTAHVCPSQWNNELLNRLEKLEKLVKELLKWR